MLISKISKFLPSNQNKYLSNQIYYTAQYLSTAKNELEVTTKSTDIKFENFDDNLNDLTSSVPDFEEAIERQENFKKRVEKLRDVSRFSKINALKKHRSELPVLNALQEHYLKTDRFYRKLYSRLGKSSGIEVGLTWPHKEELEKNIKEEKEYDLTLEQKINILIERKKNKYAESIKLEKETDELLSKMPKQIESYFQRITKKQKADEEKLNKKREILDKAREFYGYEVDMRDSRVQEMVKKLSEEKKTAEKNRKKEEEKKKTLTSSLQQKLKESEKTLKQQLKAESEESKTSKKTSNKTESKTTNTKENKLNENPGKTN